MCRRGGVHCLGGAIAVWAQRRSEARVWAGNVSLAVNQAEAATVAVALLVRIRSFPGWRSRGCQCEAQLIAARALMADGQAAGSCGELRPRPPRVSNLRAAGRGAWLWFLAREAPGLPALWPKHTPTSGFGISALLKVLAARGCLGLPYTQAFPLGRQGPGQPANLLVLAQALDCLSHTGALKDFHSHGQGRQLPEVFGKLVGVAGAQQATLQLVCCSR